MNERENLITGNGGDLTVFGTADLAVVTRPAQEQLRYARRPKKVPPELIEQALRNNPLESIPRWDFSAEVASSSVFRQQLPELMAQLLRTQFLMLADMGLTFSSTDAEIEAAVAKKTREKPDVGPYVKSMAGLLMFFRDLFAFVEFIIDKGFFSEKHLTSVYTIVSAFTSLMPNTADALRLFKPIGAQIKFNHDRYIFEIPTVLPASNLPEILLAMPVCFFGGTESTLGNDDPRPSTKMKLLCDAVGSKSFAWLYQMYNRRDRNIEQNFKGMPDPIPSDYVEFRKQLSTMVDLEVIATPYHGIASEEWKDPNWLAGIDPIAFALHRDIPFVTIFKRWSGSGIFPLLGDLMGDTISHIRTNMRLLEKFSASTYWHRGNNLYDNGQMLLGGSSRGGNNGLVEFAEKMLRAFEQGTVFEFLRT
ncbi:MAG: hypothetical protein HGA31_05555 [Candidatus Moranbacteria bacterium]|nr:hypothetical protein [Candidatus Moranbacteria bacterium]